MKVALGMAVVMLLASCGGAHQEAKADITAGPDELTLRSIRKDAARYLGCQVPAVAVDLGPWAWSQGNVVASGCGFMITYYVVCQTHGQCGYTVTD